MARWRPLGRPRGIHADTQRTLARSPGSLGPRTRKCATARHGAGGTTTGRRGKSREASAWSGWRPAPRCGDEAREGIFSSYPINTGARRGGRVTAPTIIRPQPTLSGGRGHRRLRMPDGQETFRRDGSGRVEDDVMQVSRPIPGCSRGSSAGLRHRHLPRAPPPPSKRGKGNDAPPWRSSPEKDSSGAELPPATELTRRPHRELKRPAVPSPCIQPEGAVHASQHPLGGSSSLPDGEDGPTPRRRGPGSSH